MFEDRKAVQRSAGKSGDIEMQTGQGMGGDVFWRKGFHRRSDVELSGVEGVVPSRKGRRWQGR